MELSTEKSLEIFNSMWHPLCHKSEVSSPGQWVCLPHSPDDIIVYNDRGTLICFDNVCPHRGASFVETYTGKGTLVCPYHSFCYLDGGLRTGRHKPIEAGSKTKVDLNKYHLDNIGDMIFFSPNPSIAIEEQFTSEVRSQLTEIASKISKTYDENISTFECMAVLGVENALEAVHVNSVHPDSLARLNLSTGTFDRLGLCSSWTSEIQDKRTGRAFNAIGKMIGLNVKKTYKNLLLFPFSMISSSGGISYSLQNFFPVTDDTTTFISRLYPDNLCFSNGSPVDHFLSSTAEINRQVFSEDAGICSKISKSPKKKLGKFLVQGEERIAWYREAFTHETTLRGIN
ncbi:aromatic ring-hydroxylating oxygenase subunit alpha [Nereida ignava]|uniref:aromatic ring-hydroxylating oxygenase subunit alpha n=1 Tax=Nereida ignava TaxID=282199 RepID=UPI002FE19F45